MEPYSFPKNCDFDELIQKGFGRDGGGQKVDTSCTPIINDWDFTGIVINAPKTIEFIDDDNAGITNAFPISGVIEHDLGLDLRGKRYTSIRNLVLFVVVDAKTNDVWEGRIPPPQNLIRQPPPKHGSAKKFTHEEMKGRIVGYSFNPNLLSITNMPLRETEYLVYATLGPYKSNVVTVQAKKKNKP